MSFGRKIPLCTKKRLNVSDCYPLNFIKVPYEEKFIQFSWKIIMVLIVTSIFSSLANAAKKEQLYHRQVNLSGNIFHFSMPEDFSKDMPAKDLVERLDISDIELFTKPENGNLIRRWGI